MNKLNKLLAVISFIFFTANIFAQSASITWPLTSSVNPNTPTGNIQGQAEIIGAGPSPAMVINSYNGGQRLWVGNTGWVAGSLDVTRYIQFDCSPTSGNTFTVNDVSFNYGDFPLSSNDFNILNSQVYYSTDGWANGTGIGSTLIYKNTSMQAFSVSNLNVLVSGGQTFSLRIYIYAVQNGIAMTPTFAIHNTVVINGTTAKDNSSTGAICGTKFNDVNGNGMKDSGETGLSGWIINLTYNQAAGPVTLTTTTDANGDYCFNDLAAATYTLSETQQDGWLQTYPASPGTQSVVLGPGEHKSGINFGNKVQTSSKGDACLTWDLLSSGDVTSTIGDITGQTEIIGAGSSAPLMTVFGAYTSNGQRLLVQGGWLPGSLDLSRYIEFNASPTAGNSYTINTVSFNYGDNPLATNFNIINSQVYYSTDGWTTSTQLGSTLSYLNTAMQTFTAANLNVHISSSQTFSLRIYPYSPTGSIAGTVSLAIHNTVQICGTTAKEITNTGSICGVKFNDLNGNGVKDSGEPGLANWTINLTYDQSGSPDTLTTTTDINGNYCFTQLAAGIYKISEVNQFGWQQTFPNSPGTYTDTLSAGMNLGNRNFGNKEIVSGPSGSCITWSLLSSQAVTSTTGNITGQAEVIGTGSPLLSTGAASNSMSVYGYNNGQQLWVGNTGGTWVPDPPAPSTPLLDPARYIEFNVSPNAGNSFTVTNVAFNYGDLAWSSNFNILAFKAFYSTDGWNTSTALNANPITYLNTAMSLFSQAISGVVIPSGQTFSLRIYPYPLLHGIAIMPSFATHNNVTICGTTSPINLSTGSICGIKFNDLNGNGVKDSGEPGLQNWTINLSGASNATTTTDKDGNFCFNNLAAGTYTVAEVQQNGWTQTAPTPNTYSIALAAGENKTGINFGNKATTVVGCVDPPAGMVAWWSLDETSGTTSNDLAGFNNAGTQINGPVPVAGEVLSGLQFDGINDYVEVPDHSKLNFGTGNFSIDAWLRTSETTGQKTIINKIQFPLNQGYSLYLSNGEVRLIIAASSPVFYVSSVQVADGNWHHIAVTVDRNDPSGIKFYKDGVMISASDPTTNPGTITAISPLRIGSLSFTVGDLFKGSLDEIELFNRVLTPQEINSIYSAGSAGKCKPTPQLGSICGMKFNDLNENGVKDSSEVGLQNWTINLSGTSSATTTTDKDGNFCFDNLAAGTYTVAEVQQNGWTQTAPTPNTYSITLAAGENKTGIIFGNKLTPATGCVQPPAGMVAWYPMDESLDATVVNDIIGANDGIPVPGPIGIMGSASDGPIPGSTLSFLLPHAKVDGSLYFYAGVTTKYVRVPNAPALNFGTGDFSIDAWVYPVVGSNYVQPIVDKAVTTVSFCIGYRLFILNGQLNFVVMDGANVSTTTAPITYSQWQHIAAVRKGGTPNTIELYINGVLVTTANAQVNNTSNTTDLLIGGITNPSGGTLCGLPAQFNYGEIAIDELEIFNRAITPAEIFSIWHADTFGKCKTITEVQDIYQQIPDKIELLQSYPNPFNPTATIRYNIPKESFVKISVYNILGEEIKVLVNERKVPGRYEVIFDASNFTSGVYFYSLRAGEYVQNKKMILMK